MKVNAKTGEIFIYDVIGQDWFGEGITASSVSAALDELNGARATVRINSPGGAADEGVAIYNALKRYPGGVDTHNDALAASAGSIIFLAGENRTMAAGSRVMIHRALTFAIGNATQLLKTAATLTTYDSSLVEIYSEYMDLEDDEILELLEAETWYTADEAIKAGIATKKDDKSKEKGKMAAWFKHPPSELTDDSQESEPLNTIAAINRTAAAYRIKKLASSRVDSLKR